MLRKCRRREFPKIKILKIDLFALFLLLYLILSDIKNFKHQNSKFPNNLNNYFSIIIQNPIKYYHLYLKFINFIPK